MQDLILLIGMATSFVFGFFVVLHFGGLMDQAAGERQTHSRKTLRIHVSDSCLAQELIPALRKISQNNPDVEVSLSVGSDELP